MQFIGRIKKIYNLAFRGYIEGIAYPPMDRKSYTLKTAIECLSEGFVLYAALSEVSFKISGLFSIPVPYGLGRLMSIPLGLIVCAYVIFSHQKYRNKKYYLFLKPSRMVAMMMSLFLIIALAITVEDVQQHHTRDVIPDVYSSSFEIAGSAWIIKDTAGTIASDVRVFLSKIRIPHTVGVEFEHLKLFIEPSKGFKLLDVAPKVPNDVVIPREQEPLEIGEFGDMRSEWMFPHFDETKQWEIIVRIRKAESSKAFPEVAPLRGIVYFYGK